jgi:hypothetical protein
VSTLAFDIPRLQMTANVPTVGPAPARNALKALKMFVASYVNSSPDFLQQIGEKRFVSIAQMRCRAWPHSELSPSQSESRVQAMLERLRSLTGYEFYVLLRHWHKHVLVLHMFHSCLLCLVKRVL